MLYSLESWGIKLPITCLKAGIGSKWLKGMIPLKGLSLANANGTNAKFPYVCINDEIHAVEIYILFFTLKTEDPWAYVLILSPDIKYNGYTEAHQVTLQ